MCLTARQEPDCAVAEFFCEQNCFSDFTNNGKEAGPGIVGPLTTLFNRSISLGQVPYEWKHAIVSPIYKGGRKDRRNPTNYRPISLTSCVARTIEKLLHCQVLEYLQTNGLLYEHQAGFLPNHSMVTQL